MENERKWSDLTDETQEIGLILGQKIFEDMMDEVVTDLKKIKHRREIPSYFLR